MPDDAQTLCDLGRSLFDRGLTPGRTGNLSIRLEDRVLVSPSGCSLGSLVPDGLSVMSLDGRHLDGPIPSKETFLHLAMYRARPLDRAVAHTHSTHATAVSCLAGVDDDVLPALTAYFRMRVGKLPRLPYFAPGDTSLGPVAEERARHHRALLLSNHGPVASAADLPSAVDVVEEIEETAKIWLLVGDRAVTLAPEDGLRT